MKATRTKTRRPKKPYRKLTPRERELASKYIPEEIKTGKYHHEQAVAVGISRAVATAKKTSHKYEYGTKRLRKSEIQRIMDRYR